MNSRRAAGCILVVVTLAYICAGQRAQRQPVDQLFLKIPAKYAYGLSVRERRQLLAADGRTTIDDRNGYLFISGDAASPGFYVALFKRDDGRYLTAIVWFDELNQGMHILEEDAPGWREVTRQYVPGYSKRLFYTLPQHGRVIEVSNEDRKKVGALTWDGTKFVSQAIK
ncbi:MAG TPA: hypothetical protein VFV34_06660 [Blastocatellia bacterium]|nr:hypothetical protein [Blastocatellia bacterium]